MPKVVGTGDLKVETGNLKLGVRVFLSQFHNTDLVKWSSSWVKLLFLFMCCLPENWTRDVVESLIC